MVGRVTRCMERLECELPELKVVAWCQLGDVSPRRGLQLPTAGNEVVVQVGVERVGDLDAERISPPQVAVDVAMGVDDDGFSACLVGDEEARVAQLYGWECFDRKLACHPIEIGAVVKSTQIASSVTMTAPP